MEDKQLNELAAEESAPMVAVEVGFVELRTVVERSISRHCWRSR